MLHSGKTLQRVILTLTRMHKRTEQNAPVYCYHCKLCDTSLTDLKAVFEHQKLACSVRTKIIHVELEPDIDDPNYYCQAYEVTVKEKAYYRNQLQEAHRMILKRLHPARSRYAIVPDSNNPTLLCRRI